MKYENGVYQQENGQWAYRFSILVDGKRVIQRRTKDEQGQPFKNKRAATKARKVAMAAAYATPALTARPPKKTVMEVYDEYCEKGRGGKAYSTIRKQDSLWKNHLRDKFGPRYIDEISTGEVVDYLTQLYYAEEKSYKYVESFLKMFYLIFGQAYSRNYLDVDTYNKLCLNKGTKIHMPKQKTDEDDDIATFSREEMKQLENYFCGTNGETAFSLGRYCGLRISECYGLKWANVDLNAGTILIDRQMQYQEGVYRLVPPKTRNANRTIYMSEKLKVYFQELARQRAADEANHAAARQQHQTMLADLDGSMISSLELVNTLPNGKIQTVNSMKYHSRTIKERLGIEFKYHYLRHTYGTFMADRNTPAHILCNQMGHGNIRVTQKYYIAVSEDGIEVLRRNLENL